MILEQGEYLIYTDGSCREGVGGWGFVVIKSGLKVCGYGGVINCTNNQAEMMAAVMALSCFKGDNDIILTTDSKYLCNGMSSYIYKWIYNGYKGSTGRSIKNRVLWQDLYESQLDQAPIWEWVKGHSGDHCNEMADQLALRGRVYAEGYKNNKNRETSLHNFYNVAKDKKKSKDYFVHGKPRIWREEV